MRTRTTTTRRKTTGSIQAVWPPTLDRREVKNRFGANWESGNNRWKGFFNRVLTPERFDDFRRVADQGREHGATRITIRALVDDDTLSQLQEDSSPIGLSIEAVIPLGSRYDDLNLVYFGWNDPERIPSAAVQEIHRRNYETIEGRNPKPAEELVRPINVNGYYFDYTLVDGDLERLVALYGVSLPKYLFELDEGTLTQMTDDPDNTFVVIRHEGRIISSALAEHATIEVEGYILPLVELGECATDPEYRGSGLMSAILQELIRDAEPGEIILSETRSSHIPMGIAARNVGLGVAGILPKHCIIGDLEPTEGPGPFAHMESLTVLARVIE